MEGSSIQLLRLGILFFTTMTLFIWSVLITHQNQQIFTQDNWKQLIDVPLRSIRQAANISHLGTFWQNRAQEMSEDNINKTMEYIISNLQIRHVNHTQLGLLMDEVKRTQGFRSENSTPINPHPFKYILNTEEVCHGKDIYLLCYVHTATDHYKRRSIIRQTWGNPKNYPGTEIRVIFVMGKHSGDIDAQEALTFESAEYNDIVQEDFEDSYHNLTYKGIAAMKWVSKYCKTAKYVLKTDDDIFVNMYNLMEKLKRMDREGDNRGVLLCCAWFGMPVLRSGKWEVSKEEFKDDFYPPYCSGSAYLMSADVTIALYHVSYYVPFFWVDDFYHTGLLPIKLGLKIRQFISVYVLQEKQVWNKFTGPQWYRYIYGHLHNLNKFQSIWTIISDYANGRKSPQIQALYPGELSELLEAMGENKGTANGNIKK